MNVTLSLSQLMAKGIHPRQNVQNQSRTCNTPKHGTSSVVRAWRHGANLRRIATGERQLFQLLHMSYVGLLVLLEQTMAPA